jgi:hypothetical protein
MKWEIGFSREAEKFLKRENIRPDAIAEIKNFLRRLKGEPVSVDVKNLRESGLGFTGFEKVS